MNDQETELVHKAQMGDTRAFNELVAMHDRQVLQVAYGMLGHLQDAQDVYQETFIKAYDKLVTFRFESKFSTWLTRITIRLCINHRRKQTVRKWFSLDRLKTSVDSDDPADLDMNTEQMVIDKEWSNILKYALQQLTERQRTVFVLKNFHAYKINEIAGLLNISDGTVKNTLFRATRKLASLLEPYYRSMQ